MERDIEMHQSNFKFKIGIARIFNFMTKIQQKIFYTRCKKS